MRQSNDLETKFAATVSEILENHSESILTKISEKDIDTDTAARNCSVKQMSLKTLKDLQENICVGVSFSVKLQAESLQLR